MFNSTSTSWTPLVAWLLAWALAVCLVLAGAWFRRRRAPDRIVLRALARANRSAAGLRDEIARHLGPSWHHDRPASMSETVRVLRRLEDAGEIESIGPVSTSGAPGPLQVWRLRAKG